MAVATLEAPRRSPQDRRNRYEQLAGRLLLERSSFIGHWREIAQYLFPTRPRFTVTERNRGDRRNQSIIDSTASFAARTLQSGMHAGLTSPARPWMKLTTPDPDLAKRAAVRAWLYEVTERMHTVFQLSNLYTALPQLYGDMGVFGTAAMGVLEDPGAPGRPGDVFRCYPYPIGSYAIAQDHRGKVSTFLREYPMSVAQVVEEFGGDGGRPLQHHQEIDWTGISTLVKDLWSRGSYEEQVNVRWMVQPNRAYERDRLDFRQFPYVSCHWEHGVNGQALDTNSADAQKTLRESGFHEFPVMAPRWFANPEDTYGTDCPGMMSLGDNKQLQAQQKTKARAIAKLVDPPLVGPNALRTQHTSLLPGDITYLDAREGQQGLKPVHEVRPDVQALVFDTNDTQRRIDRAFYVDLFLMLASGDNYRGGQPPTATEINERHEEKLIALGPVLESTEDELLDPLTDRVFAMMLRNGLIPPPPPELEGVDLVVEYISIMAQAQKLTNVVALDRFAGTMTNLAGAGLPVLHKLNAFRIVDDYQDALGIDPALVLSDEAAQAALQQQQQAAQQHAEAEANAKNAMAVQRLGATPLGDQAGGDTALRRIVEGVTQ